MPIRLIATSLALIGFAAAIIAGIVVDNPAATTLWRALLAMLGCYVFGSVIGAVAQRALDEQIDRYKREHPLADGAGDAAAPPEPGAEARGAPGDEDAEQRGGGAGAAPHDRAAA